MKNRNLAKLLVLALSLALLIGTVAGISVSAASVDNLIVAQTIVHGAKIQIAIAVDAPSADGVTVSYQWAGEDTAKDAKYDATANYKDGTVVFVTEGVAAYELAKVATITVSYGGNTQTKTYSVAQFLYTKLNKATITDEARDCYEALLTYGQTSQIHLNQNTNALVKDSFYVTSNNVNVTLNGDDFLYGAPGSKITVTPRYNGAGILEGWTYGKTGVENVLEGTSVEVSSTTIFTPVVSEAGELPPVYALDFESDVTKGVNLYTYSDMSGNMDVHQTTITANSSASKYYGAVGKLVADPTDASNQVLSVVVNGSVNNSNTKTGNYVSSIIFEAQDKTANGKIHVVEFDMNIDHINKASFKNPFEMYAYDKDGKVVTNLQNNSTTAKYNGFVYFDAVEADGDDANKYHFGNGEVRTSEASTVAQFDTNKWYRFRVTWDEANNKVYFAVSFDNGENWYAAFIGDRNTNAATGEVAAIGFQFNHYGVGYTVLFDNISYNIVDTLPEVGAIARDNVEYPSGR